MLEPYVSTLQEIADNDEYMELNGRPPGAGPRKPRMTNRQLDFLRQVRMHPNGLPLMKWPRATTLRKWMRRPRFAAAITALEEAFHTEARLLMSGSAAMAAGMIQTILTGGSREYSGIGSSPQDVSFHAKAMKQCLAVMWAEMARREQTRRAGIQAAVLKRIGTTSID